jgi:AraC-like DNA-binding protein
MSSLLAHPPSLHFSSEALPERDRIASFREAYGQKILRLDVEPVPDAPFHADIKLYSFPGLTMASEAAGGARARRTRSLASDGNDDILLMRNSSGIAIASQFGREVKLHAGDAVLLSCADPGEVFRPHTVRNLGVYVPRSALAALIPRVDEAIVRPIPRSSEALRLLTSYIGVLNEGNELTTPELSHSVVTHVHDLVACIIGDISGNDTRASAGGMRAARLRAVKVDVAANITRHDLSLDTVAARHNISPSYIRKLLDTEGTTFTDLVLGQRLLLAHRMLTDPRHAGRRVSEIAFAAGFNDLSYFNRAYRLRFGCTPSDTRAAMRHLHDAGA